MTDNDIKKALECCMKSTSRRDCEELHCPAHEKRGCYFDYMTVEDYPVSLINGISIFLLDLINRQQAEIERLERELIEERTRRKNAVNSYHEAKTEAIKEFIKRFEKNIKDVKFTIGQTWEIQCAIKQTLKDMTESVNYESSKTEGVVK